MLERLIYNNYDPDKEMYSTKEDIYLCQLDIRNRRELLRIHDTSGAVNGCTGKTCAPALSRTLLTLSNRG